MAKTPDCQGYAGSLRATQQVESRSAIGAEHLRQASPCLDIHIHLFGAGDSGSGCRLSKTITEGPAFESLSNKMGFRHRAATLDGGYALALVDLLRHSSLQKGAILSQDAVYDQSGAPDWSRTHFYIPNDYLFQVVALCPDIMIPCISINPQRVDAMDSVLGSAGRVGDVVRLLADAGAHERLLHGSDFPFPVAPDAFIPVVGESKAAEVRTVRNPLDQDLALKQALGIGQSSAERAYRLICGEDV